MNRIVIRNRTHVLKSENRSECVVDLEVSLSGFFGGRCVTPIWIQVGQLGGLYRQVSDNID